VGKSAEILTAGLAQPVAAPADRDVAFASVLADVMNVEQVPADGHFFDDLGADSMVMARFCARVRKRPDLPSVSMKDIYQHPTISSLATALDAAAPAAPAADQPAPAGPAPPEEPAEAAPRRRTAMFVTCGVLQFLFFLGYSYLAAVIAVRAYQWISHGPGGIDIYLRAAAFGGAAFVVLCTLPIVAKWVLIGRWKPRQIPVWSLSYLRFWIVKTLVRSNPVALLFGGTPLYPLYLRALGARVGRRVAVWSRHVPVCTDLLTIGEGTVIRKDAYFQCYRAHAGRIEAGPVTLGRDVFVGEKAILDIGTSMGDGSQLGHTSALHSGQGVPGGEQWHGSPAQPADVDYLRVEPARCGPLRRTVFCVVSLLLFLLVVLPLLEGAFYLILTRVPALDALLAQSTEVSPARLLTEALALSALLFFGALIAGLILVATVPRLLSLLIKADTAYPLYGLQYRVHRTITRLSTVKFFNSLFGDSSYIVGYLRWNGYDLSRVEQTGSNFGTAVAHETPYLCTVGSGTMVADGLSMMNADYSSTSFRVSRVSIGPHNFVGNHIAFPPGGRTGENCLLATKAMIPLDGALREGVGLLGSPCFEIPRSVERDSRFDHLRTGKELRRRLSAKNRYNLRTMGVFLFARWLHFFLITVLGLVAIDLYGTFAQAVVAVFFALTALLTPAYYALAEWSITRFRRLRPRYCSIYDPYFWRVERLWKLPAIDYIHLYDGTPFKNLIWRMLGVRLGRRVFDDGCYITERTLAAIGDDCTLNVGSTIQCHSQEDGTFKSDRSAIGARSTLGVAALVHYGVTIGEDAVLAPDSFLMKGEEIPQHAQWGGNPAQEMSDDHYQPA
jgi:non-ribosomal peptide synthetase-like protein